MRKNTLICLILAMILFIFASCGSNGENEAEAPTIAQEETLEIYYDKNEGINLFLNNYNKANPEATIEIGMFETYHHHGQDHEDQIIMQQGDYEIVCSDGYNFDVVISGGNGDDNSFKEVFMRFAKGYNPELTNEELNGYWNEILNSDSPSIEFETFECLITHYDVIELIKISGEISR